MKQQVEGMLWVVSFLSLIVAAMTTGKSYLMVLAVIWIVSSMLVIPLHFYKAWRRLSQVANKRQYAAWVGFETIATVAFIALFVCAVFSR
jgi:hypothetical protein